MSPSGDASIGMSGGQRQLIAIACVLLKNPPLLLLLEIPMHVSLIAQGGLYANLAVLQFHTSSQCRVAEYARGVLESRPWCAWCASKFAQPSIA